MTTANPSIDPALESPPILPERTDPPTRLVPHAPSPGPLEHFIDGSKPPTAIDLRELWAYRELLWFLTARDLKLRYKQTLLGAGWAVIQPLIQMGLFTIILGYVAGLRHSTPGVPYAVLTFSALLPWQLFSSALGNASNSLVGNERLVTKVYFPRVIIPAASIMARVVDFGVCSAVMLGLLAIYRITPGWGVVLIPLFVGWALLLAFAGGLYLSALNVRWRDIGHATPFLLQALMWLSGVFFPSSLIPPWARFYFHLNPVANLVDSFRWALLGPEAQAFPPLLPYGLSLAGTFVLLALGLRHFRRAEETFADVI